MKNRSFLLSAIASAVSFFGLSVLANEGTATSTHITEDLCDPSWPMRQCLDSIVEPGYWSFRRKDLTKFEIMVKAA